MSFLFALAMLFGMFTGYFEPPTWSIGAFLALVLADIALGCFFLFMKAVRGDQK